MTTLLAERTHRTGGGEPPAGPTLERLVAGAWGELVTHDAAVCPVCDGEMSRPLPGSAYGTCSTCGTELS